MACIQSDGRTKMKLLYEDLSRPSHIFPFFLKTVVLLTLLKTTIAEFFNRKTTNLLSPGAFLRDESCIYN